MAVGLDYSSGPIDPAAILAAGYSAVFRYVDDPAYGLPPKCITGAEYIELAAAGIDVYLVFEHLTDDYTGGFLAGAVNAQRALTGANGLSYSGPIFMAIDTDPDMTATQVAMALDYLDGAAHILGGRLGIYGFAEVIQSCQTQNLGSVYWQCGHQPGAGVHVWQDNTMTVTVDGVECDIDRILLSIPEMADDMAAVPQSEWDDVYTQICGLFEAWAGGGTGDPSNAEYDFIQFLLRANVQLTQLTQEVAALTAKVDALTPAGAVTTVTIDDTEVKRVADEAIQAAMNRLASSISSQRS